MGAEKEKREGDEEPAKKKRKDKKALESAQWPETGNLHSDSKANNALTFPVFLDRKLASQVGGEEAVMKKLQEAFQQIKDRKYDAGIPSQYQTLRHVVVIWNNKAQVVAYDEHFVGRR